MEQLQKEYNAWLKANVPANILKENGGGFDAWELMAYINNEDEEWNLTQAQYDWLADFSERWKKGEQA